MQTKGEKRMKKQILSVLAALALTARPCAAATHIAEKGDTYWLIAQRYGVSLSALLNANGASETGVLNIGDAVIIPTTAAYTAKKGDSYWLISRRFGVSLEALLEANGKNERSALNIGDAVTIPSPSLAYTVQKGDSYWLISQRFGVSLDELLSLNNAGADAALNIGEVIAVPSKATGGSGPAVSNEGNKNGGAYVTYKTYTVKNDDTLWSIAIDSGIPFSELLEANGLNENSLVRPGQTLTVPVHHVPVKAAPAGCGELLDWWSEAQYVVPINAVFTVYDINSGRSFQAKRTVGANHADCETLTADDTAVMTSIWGGTPNWSKRPVLIKINGRAIAASAAGMYHAGNEWAAGGAWTDWRSDNYGPGINYDYVKGNNASGHFDIHFYNSLKHSDGKSDSAHQSNVKKAAGLA